MSKLFYLSVSVLYFCAFFHVSSFGDDCNNNRPIIGVLTQPWSDKIDVEILVASYVKHLESAGARVVPLRFSSSHDDLAFLLSKLNGLFFPGGNVNIFDSAYGEAARYLLSKALEMNSKGIFFPVWGTCLGFEQILSYSRWFFVPGYYIFNGSPYNSSILSPMEDENVFLNLKFSENYKESKLMKNCPDGEIEAFEHLNGTINMHMWGVLQSTFSSNSVLNSSFSAIALSRFGDAPPFVSLMEHRLFPIFGSQFHPEKNIFEWSQGHPDYVHSSMMIQASQYLMNTFVDFSRCNKNTFPTKMEEEKHLIYQRSPEFTGFGNRVEQTYVFQ